MDRRAEGLTGHVAFAPCAPRALREVEALIPVIERSQLQARSDWQLPTGAYPAIRSVRSRPCFTC
ncbi:MAG: hypothetical protein HQL91_07120 [Magnetococcales bacterium]|nr:hypothetical protein [Magnetococcales bacterium]